MIVSKKKEIRQCSCGGKCEHLGFRHHETLTSSGLIDTERLYCGCKLCRTNIHPTDELLGIDGRYTIGLRDLAVFAGADGSFAQKHLLKKGIFQAPIYNFLSCDRMGEYMTIQINLPDKRLNDRYLELVKAHAQHAPSTAAGPAIAMDTASSFAATQAAWRFFANPKDLSRNNLYNCYNYLGMMV